jgi:hypothetical protein
MLRTRSSHSRNRECNASIGCPRARVPGILPGNWPLPAVTRQVQFSDCRAFLPLSVASDEKGHAAVLGEPLIHIGMTTGVAACANVHRLPTIPAL